MDDSVRAALVREGQAMDQKRLSPRHDMDYVPNPSYTIGTLASNYCEDREWVSSIAV